MNQKLSNHYKSTGFTLVELLISVVIITIISSFGIASFIGANRNATVKAQAQELKTLIRKLRTDAGAALKPNNGCSTSGIVYGSYLSVAVNSATVNHGLSCFSSDGLTDYSSTNTVSLKNGLLQGSPDSAQLTVFFSFNGEVKFLNTLGKPSLAQINSFGGSVVGDSIRVVVTDGASIGTGNRRQITINQNGLVCDETYGLTGSSSCALQ